MRLTAVVACLLVGCSFDAAFGQQAPLWNERAGDNVRLMQTFLPPQPDPALSQTQPSGLYQWQQEQAGTQPLSLFPQQPQAQQTDQPQQQTSSQAAMLTELAVALLRAAAVSNAPPPPQQAQQPQQDPNVNLYGPTVDAVAPPSEAPGDIALLLKAPTARAAAEDDTILPLARSGSAYGFTVPPVDIQEKLRAAEAKRHPKPVSDLERFWRLRSQRARPLTTASNNAARSLEAELRSQPDRSLASIRGRTRPAQLRSANRALAPSSAPTSIRHRDRSSNGESASSSSSPVPSSESTSAQAQRLATAVRAAVESATDLTIAPSGDYSSAGRSNTGQGAGPNDRSAEDRVEGPSPAQLAFAELASRSRHQAVATAHARLTHGRSEELEDRSPAVAASGDPSAMRALTLESDTAIDAENSDAIANGDEEDDSNFLETNARTTDDAVAADNHAPRAHQQAAASLADVYRAIMRHERQAAANRQP